MPPSPSTEAPAPAFICDCEVQARSACEGLPFFKEKEGERYCVLHYPGREKGAPFREALGRKFIAGDFDFRGVWFPGEADFSGVAFQKSADFSYAAFGAGANFSWATFESSAYFSHAVFAGRAAFMGATFKGGTYFGNVTFGAEADFTSAAFGGELNFSFATFKDYVRFAEDGEREVFGNNSRLKLRFAKIEHPERLSFRMLTLRPHWFVGVDARNFEFINVNWNWPRVSTTREIESIKDPSPHRLLAIACRNLAVNCEENHRYGEASQFRYMVMEAGRLESLLGFAPWKLSWWYWLASGYGERAWRAFAVLLGVWALSAALYTRAGFARWEPRVSSEREAAEAKRDEVGAPLPWPRALTYSLGVMTLQKPEPRPATDAAQALVMLETILGPVQAALLALAIRRKFMR